MSDDRQPMMLSAVGKKGVGKTIETIKFIYEYNKGTSTMKGRKALIFDVNNEFSSFWFPDPAAGMVRHSIKRIAIKDIPKFSNSNICEVRRVAPYWDNNVAMTNSEYSVALEKILSYYRNGLLLLEDINKYTTENMKADLIGRIISNRHIGLDIVLHFQGVGRVLTPKILSNTNIIRMHKTTDNVLTYSERAEDKVNILSIAENIVNVRYRNAIEIISHFKKTGIVKRIIENDVEYKKDDRYFNLLVNNDDDKIVGDFNIKEAELAIMTYLSVPKSKTLINQFLNQRDSNGKKCMTEEGAYIAAKDSLLKEYFDF